MTDIFSPSARKEARRARRQEESRAKTIALLEELCKQTSIARLRSNNIERRNLLGAPVRWPIVIALDHRLGAE